MTLDTVRAAVLSDQPWARLDELVRAELAAGRPARQVGEELRGMQNDLEDTPGLSEDGNDALLDTLESLFQLGPRRYWYENPPVLPTEQEIAALPRWARVAFAARCARRVLPLFRYNWPDAPEQYENQLRLVVELVESVAQYNDVSEVEAGPVTCAAYVIDAVINSRRNRQRAEQVVVAMPQALVRLRHEVSPLFQQVFGVFARHTAVAIADCTATRREEYDAAWRAAVTTVRTDYDCLARLARDQHWTDATTVPPSVFGPLWPDGPPPHWPAVAPDAPAVPVFDPNEVVQTEYQPGFPEALGQPPGLLAGVTAEPIH